MNTIKQTLQTAEHYPDARQTVFYIDIRAFGKGFEDLYRRSREESVDYVRGIPGSVVARIPRRGDLLVHVENTLTGSREEHRFDLLVLADRPGAPQARRRAATASARSMRFSACRTPPTAS